MEILDQLIVLGADLNTPDRFGWTALNYCFNHFMFDFDAMENSDSSSFIPTKHEYLLKMANTLLKAGANLYNEDRMKVTPLYSAVKARYVEAVDLLMRHKADPYRKHFYGFTMFDCTEDTAVLKCLHMNDKERVKRLQDEAREKTTFMKCGNCKVRQC